MNISKYFSCFSGRNARRIHPQQEEIQRSPVNMSQGNVLAQVNNHGRNTLTESTTNTRPVSALYYHRLYTAPRNDLGLFVEPSRPIIGGIGPNNIPLRFARLSEANPSRTIQTGRQEEDERLYADMDVFERSDSPIRRDRIIRTDGLSDMSED